MADFDLFESLVTAESEGHIHRAALEKNLKTASFQVRSQFGNYLANAESTTDYDERFSYLTEKIASSIANTVEPTKEVLGWLKNEFAPQQEKRSKLARNSTGSQNTKQAAPRDPRTVVGGVDWNWDTESNSFKSSKSSNFNCVCGGAITGVGQHACKCGRLWNMHSITDSNKTAGTPLFVCREVMRRDTVLASKKADKIDPKDPHKHHESDEWEYSDGYDVKDLIGPAAGEEEHDGHLSALDMIFAADEEDNSEPEFNGDEAEFPEDSAMPEAAPEPMAPPVAPPMPPAQPSGMDMLNGDPAGIEDQPAENVDIEQAQQLILDMILREKAEEVVDEKSNHDEIQQLNDAYQSLDVVQDLENADSMSPMPGASMLAYRAAMQQGYVLGFLEALANSYEDRSSEFEGFEDPIPNVSNGLDDADGAYGKDTTPELRELLKNQFDSDNAANKDQKPLDPAKPFGADKGKSSRFQQTQ